MNDKMVHLISLKNRLFPGPLRPTDRQRVYRALYDLDNFRTDLFSMVPGNHIKLDEQILDRARSSERDLLDAGLKWVAAFLTHLSINRGRDEK